MNHIYIPYSPGALENKDELDRKVGLVVRTFFEDVEVKKTPIGSITFVLFVERDYKDWLAGDEDTEAAKTMFMEQQVFKNQDDAIREREYQEPTGYKK